MKIDDIEISKAFLESGRDLVLSDHIVVKHPSIGEILELGNGIYCDAVYWNYVFSLLCDPYDNMVWLDDNGIDFEKTTSFDVFVMKWDQLISQVRKSEESSDGKHFDLLQNIKSALSFFLGDHDFDLGVYESGERAIYDRSNPEYQINREAFNYIIAFIRGINGITHTDKINPSDENAKRILIDDMRAEEKKRSRKKDMKYNDIIGNMMSAVAYGGNGGITPFNICNVKIFQLYSSLNINQKKMHYQQVMSGVYHGTIRFDSINKLELNWME